MKLTKRQQNGLLLVLYIARAGRCKLSEAAEQLGVSLHFLEQIARSLRVSGVLVSFRGPGGGYELLAEPTIGQVLLTLGWKPERVVYKMSGVSEKRALAQLMVTLGGALAPILRRKVNSLNLELAANETAAMVGLEQGTVN